MNDISEIEHKLLQTLSSQGVIENSGIWAEEHQIKHDILVGIIYSLTSNQVVEHSLFSKNVILFTEEAEEILKLGSAEARTFQAIPTEGILKTELESKLGNIAKIGFGKALQNDWINFDKSSGKVFKKVDNIQDTLKMDIEQLKKSSDNPNPKLVETLKKRKLASQSVMKFFKVTKGQKFSSDWKKAASEFTVEMITKETWKNTEFKPYNFNSLGLNSGGGYLHPLLKVKKEIREIFLELGFEEMPTNNWVESSFWNFDALFQPQQHPVRDAHDTFFLSDPQFSLFWPEDYKERVKAMHEKGGQGSLGWRYDWSLEESRKNILRTHTTAVSSRMLYKLAQDGFKPKKYFSIDRVFRNEAIDSTHLAEFNQIEGLVADYDLTLGNLMGIISLFFERLGMKDIKFKPAFNPYTEPSMEVFGYHEGLKKWVEVGNSGIFRPEMLLPMGLPPNVRVIAWGLSLERPTMIKYGISKITKLEGHGVDLEYIQNNPMCRFNE